VDIALDPFPYPGGTTTVEGLWMGVPVLTLTASSFLSRQGVGILMNTGLADWVANSADEYVALALSHVRDLQRLAILRNGLRYQALAAPIMNAQCFTRQFESMLRDMVNKYTNGLALPPVE
jgi:predicted O-linked N-acetylglucosamine transferase (SPINDLY family)